MNHHFKSQRYWRARLFLFLFIFIATVSSALAEEGYWVLVKSEIQENDAGISHNGSGKSITAKSESGEVRVSFSGE